MCSLLAPTLAPLIFIGKCYKNPQKGAKLEKKLFPKFIFKILSNGQILKVWYRGKTGKEIDRG